MKKYVPDRLEPALALRFSVKIDDHEFTRFTAVDGLTAEWEVEEYREGGNMGFVHRLPVRMLFKNVRLTRAVDRESGSLSSWFCEAQSSFTRGNATITAYDGNQAVIATWELKGAWPIKYTGPSLTSNGTAAATEILELAHNGFTVTAG
jgi:phage tail-like protein